MKHIDLIPLAALAGISMTVTGRKTLKRWDMNDLVFPGRIHFRIYRCISDGKDYLREDEQR